MLPSSTLSRSPSNQKRRALRWRKSIFQAPCNKRERRIKVLKPAANAIESITKVLADTWDVKIAVIACLPRAWANEDHLAMLSTKSCLAIQSVALLFVLGDRWRTLLAKAIVKGSIDTRSIWDQVTRGTKQKG